MANELAVWGLLVLLTLFTVIIVKLSIMWATRHFGYSRKETVQMTRMQILELACNLAKAASVGENAEKCIYLIEKHKLDVNLNLRPLGLSIFLSSCLSSNAKLIRYLLKNDANAQCTTHNGDTALYLAVYAYIYQRPKSLATIKLLIDAGCSVHQRNKGGYTPLQLAACLGIENLVEYFVSEGSNQEGWRTPISSDYYFQPKRC